MTTSNKSYPLSAGEVLRSKEDWWMKGSHVDPIKMRCNRILLAAEKSFKGFVGESIECYSYCVLDCSGDYPAVIPIQSVEDFKKEAYPFLYKNDRIAYWREMKQGSLFGWSEDPRPYVE